MRRGGVLVTTIQILGSGCAKCTALAENVRVAVEESGIEARVEKVEDLREIMKYRVMVTPALVVDGEVKSAGKPLTVQQIRKLIE
jgi:small redox-active disulfide protein 2